MSDTDRHLDEAIATAILGVDTLWGGDVMNPSGAGRFIADSWFSNVPLPQAYTDQLAASLRQSGGASAAEPDHAAVRAYLTAIDVRGAIAAVATAAPKLERWRGAALTGLADSLQVMLELALEVVGEGEPVPYERCVIASCGRPPSPSSPEGKIERLGTLLSAAGYPANSGAELAAAAGVWRRERTLPKPCLAALSDALIAQLDAFTVRNVVPYLPAALARVPRANVRFVSIPDAVFSGSMNYLGRARTPAGEPLYDAAYEINASLEISIPEFAGLVSHEVVPGHVTTFAYLQNLFVRGKVGFEATVFTMNSRATTLAEGIANNALLFAYGARSIEDLPDPDLKIGMLLSCLQDDAKNQASFLTWRERWPQAEVAAVLAREFLVTEERADKLSGAWGRHPLLGRMYLPCYRAGTEMVARLWETVPPAKLLPALYGCRGLVDIVTLPQMLGVAT